MKHARMHTCTHAHMHITCARAHAHHMHTCTHARTCTHANLPQADPSHYAEMVNRASAGGGSAHQPLMMLNVRCQRLDQWLTSNAAVGLRAPLFFADFETGILGKPKLDFSPLVDLQRFLRWGYARLPLCLLGVTPSASATRTCMRHLCMRRPPPPPRARACALCR